MKNVYTVAQVNAYIKNMFTQDFLLASLSIRGEVSNCKYHSSGHIYFTLKDKTGTIACVMFAGNRKGLSFSMKEGQQVVVNGTVDVYERDGKYQLYAKEITLDGAGFLYEKFLQVKKELEEMGMFSDSYKQKIPRYCKKLGIVTAPTGAAVWDIIRIAKRRNPSIQIILYPAIVQGEQAAESICNGIRAMEKVGADTLIVGRGGGSIEDLWAFNERVVAEAIFNCQIPVISAVGHETDTTIADFVADLRAPTPSAAAELAVFEQQALLERLEGMRDTITGVILSKIEGERSILERAALKLQYLSPVNQIREKRTHVMQLEEQLGSTMKQLVEKRRHRLELYLMKMRGLSPLDKLSHGFSYVTNEQGNSVTDVNQVKSGDSLLIQVKNGEIHTEVRKVQKVRRSV